MKIIRRLQLIEAVDHIAKEDQVRAIETYGGTNVTPFHVFLVARAAVSLVTAMLSIAIGWHLYQNSGDPFDLALVGVMQVTPIFLFFRHRLGH